MLLCFAKQMMTVGQFDDIPYRCQDATDHEPFMDDEGHVIEYTFLALRLLKFAPLVGGKKSILVGYL